MSEFVPDKIPPRVNERYKSKSKFIPDKMIVEREKIDRNPNKLVKFKKICEEKHMIHIVKDNIHEYWESDMYEKHLKEPYCGSWHPYYVCYVYEK